MNLSKMIITRAVEGNTITISFSGKVGRIAIHGRTLDSFFPNFQTRRDAVAIADGIRCNRSDSSGRKVSSKARDLIVARVADLLCK